MRYWTAEEDLMIAFAFSEEACLTDQMHLFPGRSIISVRKRAARIGCRSIPGNTPVRPKQMLSLLLERGPLTARQMADIMGIHIATVHPVLARLKVEKKIYVIDRVTCGAKNVQKQWAIGDKPDAPSMKQIRAAEAAEIRRARKTKTEVVRPVTVINVHRDPLVAAFFGGIAA